MKALLIEFNQQTGRRAGDINPRDPALQCYGWQNLDVEPALEIRIIEDDRDIEQYRDIPGVTVLNGKDEINKMIDQTIPDRYSVADMSLLIEHAKQRGIPLDRFINKTPSEIAKIAYQEGLAGAYDSTNKNFLK